MTISKEQLYDYSIGSALFFEARDGAVRTKMYRRHFDASLADAIVQCRTCGDDKKNIEHIVLQCEYLYPRPSHGSTLPRALGFVEGYNTLGRICTLVHLMAPHYPGHSASWKGTTHWVESVPSSISWLHTTQGTRLRGRVQHTGSNLYPRPSHGSTLPRALGFVEGYNTLGRICTLVHLMAPHYPGHSASWKGTTHWVESVPSSISWLHTTQGTRLRGMVQHTGSKPRPRHQ
ncbi:hypothetical protein MTO96_031292 [Rhipicephalus appendiculatus]